MPGGILTVVAVKAIENGSGSSTLLSGWICCWLGQVAIP